MEKKLSTNNVVMITKFCSQGTWWTKWQPATMTLPERCWVSWQIFILPSGCLIFGMIFYVKSLMVGWFLQSIFLVCYWMSTSVFLHLCPPITLHSFYNFKGLVQCLLHNFFYPVSQGWNMTWEELKKFTMMLRFEV